MGSDLRAVWKNREKKLLGGKQALLPQSRGRNLPGHRGKNKLTSKKSLSPPSLLPKALLQLFRHQEFNVPALSNWDNRASGSEGKSWHRYAEIKLSKQMSRCQWFMLFNIQRGKNAAITKVWSNPEETASPSHQTRPTVGTHLIEGTLGRSCPR